MKTTLLSAKAGQIQAMQHDEKADKIPAEAPFEGAHSQDYDAVLLPGGALNADNLRMHEEVRRFVREMDRAKKPVDVICHAPRLRDLGGPGEGSPHDQLLHHSGRRPQCGRRLEG